MLPNLKRIAEERVYRITAPSGWRDEGNFIHSPECSAAVYRNRTVGLLVLLSSATMDDGGVWIHCSLSRKSRLPSWDDMKRVKDAFFGEDSEAFHVLPKKDDYINLHPFCMHLWTPAETEREQLEKEADWLALALANACCGLPLSEYINENANGMSPPAPEHWREAARNAVMKHEN